MATKTDCKTGGSTLPNGNCTVLGADGQPVQCVGPWAEDKHHYLGQYIEATWAVRADYLPPKGVGGAAFIDLFAGPGQVRDRDSGQIYDGSPMLAFRHASAPFSRLIYCDIDEGNVRALRARTASDAGRVTVIEGDCNVAIDQVTAAVPQYGFNIALIDPFGLRTLKFETLRRLSAFKRMDLVVHIPTGDIKRNLGQSENSRRWLDEALGTAEWARRITSNTDIATVIDVFKEQLATLGYLSQQVRSPPIKNNQNLPLYYLVYASKSRLGDKIWQSITKNAPTGQRGMGW